MSEIPAIPLTPERLNEKVLLGSLLVNEDIRNDFAFDISPEDFIDPDHACFAYAISYAHGNNITVTTDSIFELSTKYNNKVEIMYDTLLHLVKIGNEQNINATSFKYYLERVRCRTLAVAVKLEYGDKFIVLLKNPDAKYSDIITSIESMRDKFITSKIGNDEGYKSLKMYEAAWRAEFEIRKKGRTFSPSGYPHLDYFLTEGFAMGKVSVVAGRPGSGKSSFVCNIMDRISIMSTTVSMSNVIGGPPISPFILSRPIPCALCALEMNSIGTIDRLLAIRTRLPLIDIIRNPSYLNKDELKTIDTFVTDFADNRYLYIDDTPQQNIDILAQRITRLKKKINSEELIVFVDLFGKLEDMNENIATTTAAAYESTLRKIQILARDLNVHFCLVAQIGRKAEAVRDKAKKNKVINNRPAMRHLKNSGAFEEVADLILLLYRQKYYQPDLTTDICEVNIAKQRQGVGGKVVNLLFDGITTTLHSTNERLVEQEALNLNIVTERDFSNEDKYLYYSGFDREEKEKLNG